MIHIAGSINNEGIQRCERCGFILTDYRNAMISEGDPPLVGWVVGSFIEVIMGNPTYFSLTINSPNCVSLN